MATQNLRYLDGKSFSKLDCWFPFVKQELVYSSDQDLILLKIAQIASTGSLLRLVGIVLGNLQFSGWCVPKRGEFPPDYFIN